MAARRGTSRDRRAAAPGPAPTRDHAAATRLRTPAPLLAAALVACEPPATDPHRELPGSSSTADADTGPTPPAADSTGPITLDTDAGPSGYPAPDCATMILPGPPGDVTASPRPDHDAEVLALTLDPARAAARQADYDVVTADLAAIRTLDPSLADVHVGCVIPNGITFWFFDDEPVNDALLAGDYHAWDCHNAYFRVRQAPRIDGLAVAIELPGVFGAAVADAYAALPGLADQTPYWFTHAGWPVPARTGPDCAPAAGEIMLTATLAPAGTLDQRDYRFERSDGTSVVYRVTPTAPPQVLR